MMCFIMFCKLYCLPGGYVFLLDNSAHLLECVAAPILLQLHCLDMYKDFEFVHILF